MTRKLLCAGLMFLLAGCAGVTAVPAGKTVSLGDGVSVTPATEWSQITLGSARVWTVNGLGLDEVLFYTGIQNGKPLYAVAGKTAQLGSFSATMSPNDIQDLAVTTMGQEGYQNVRAANLAPCQSSVGNHFCFDLEFLTGDGLEMKGKAIAMPNKGKLELVEFLAPSEYYYPSLAPTVDKLFAAIAVE